MELVLVRTVVEERRRGEEGRERGGEEGRRRFLLEGRKLFGKNGTEEFTRYNSIKNVILYRFSLG